MQSSTRRPSANPRGASAKLLKAVWRKSPTTIDWNVCPVRRARSPLAIAMFNANNTAAPTTVARKLTGIAQPSVGAKKSDDRHLDHAAEDRWKRSPGMVSKSSVPRDSAAELSDFSGSKRGNPASNRRPSQGHRGNHGREPDSLLGPHWESHRQRRRDQREDRPEGNARKNLRVGWRGSDLCDPSSDVENVSAISSLRRVQKSRDHERHSAQSHDSGDVQL